MQAHQPRLGLATSDYGDLITAYNTHNIKLALFKGTCCPDPEPVRPHTG